MDIHQQTEAWRVARDIQREHEQYVRDNEGIHCGGVETPEMRKANEAFEMEMFGQVMPRQEKDWGFVNTVSYSVPSNINIESKQYGVNF